MDWLNELLTIAHKNQWHRATLIKYVSKYLIHESEHPSLLKVMATWPKNYEEMAGKEWSKELLPSKEPVSINEFLRISPGSTELEVRSDIPEELRGRVVLKLIHLYRLMFGEEPEGVHKLAAPEAIGLLELSVRTSQKMELPRTQRDMEINGFPMSTTGAYYR